MQKALQNRSSSLLATVLLAALAGCSTTGGDKPAAAPERIKESELRAYCPAVALRDNSAYYNSYERGGDKDPNRLIYQASLTDATRACQYGEGTITMEIAAAGRVVPGPKYQGGAVSVPVRVTVLQGDQTLYSKVEQQTVSMSGDVAGQFVVNQKGVTFPTPSTHDIQIFVGLDEHPAAAAKPAGKRKRK